MRYPQFILGFWFLGLLALNTSGQAEEKSSTQEIPLLTPLQAVRMALEKSHQLKRWEAESRLRKAELLEQKNPFLPKVTLKLGTWVQGPRVLLGEKDPVREVLLPHFSRAELTAEQVVYHLGLSKAREIVKAKDQSLNYSQKWERMGVILETLRAYYQLMSAEAMEQIAQENLKRAKEQGEQIQRRIEAGFSAPIEKMQGENDIDEAYLQWQKARNGRLLALAQLNRLLNRPLEAPLTLSSSPPLEPLPDLENLLKKAQDRPDVKALEASLRMAQVGSTLVKTLKAPSLILQGSLVQQNRTALAPSRFFSVGLVLTWPLLSLDITKEMAQAQAEEERTTVSLEELKQGVELEVRSAYYKALEAQTQIAIAHKRAERAQSFYTSVQRRFNQGLASLQEVRSAQADLYQAQILQAKALADYHIALAELFYSSGTLEEALSQ